jgi:hypothetical protein
MRRTKISLPKNLAQDIGREAQQRREAGGLPFIGIGHSGTSDTARRAEEILAGVSGGPATDAEELVERKLT